MKQNRWYVTGALIFSAFISWQLSNNSNTDTPTLDLLGVETLAMSEELPGIGITCGSGENKGRCWDGECETTWTPFGFYRAWNCNRATGYTGDFCSDYVPC